jgi:hypothetical protein
MSGIEVPVEGLRSTGLPSGERGWLGPVRREPVNRVSSNQYLNIEKCSKEKTREYPPNRVNQMHYYFK